MTKIEHYSFSLSEVIEIGTPYNFILRGRVSERHPSTESGKFGVISVDAIRSNFPGYVRFLDSFPSQLHGGQEVEIRCSYKGGHDPYLSKGMRFTLVLMFSGAYSDE